MVRSTWAGISVRRNKQSRRYIKRRFKNQQHNFPRATNGDAHETIELPLMTSADISPAKCNTNRSSKKSVRIDNAATLTISIASSHSDDQTNGLPEATTSHINDFNVNSDERFSGSSRRKKRSVRVLPVDEDQTGNKNEEMSSLKVPEVDLPALDVKQSEDKDFDEHHLPRIHTHNDTSSGRNVVGLAWVTLAIVFIFMICHSIKWIANFYEMIMVRYSKVFLAPIIPSLNQNYI